MKIAILYVLLAAVLFGASTPFAKLLTGQISPVLLAGLLYLGSGAGLLGWLLVRRTLPGRRTAARGMRLTRADLPWLTGAVVAGGIVAPVLLIQGLTVTPGSTAALLLNTESVFTALIAWFVFRENFDRRIALGMLLIVAAGILLSFEPPAAGALWGAAAIFAACLFWAVDNNLTRRISGSDAVQIAGVKGLAAGVVNLGIAFLLGSELPGALAAAAAAAVGLLGYGISLVLFVLGLRHLGTARTGAYFAVAPFVGAVVAMLALRETPNAWFWAAAALMGAGVWLHVTERHEHDHSHTPLSHTHPHRHDEHHQHAHDFPCDDRTPHTHEHHHASVTHRHAHYPDIHHRHH